MICSNAQANPTLDLDEKNPVNTVQQMIVEPFAPTTGA